MISRLATNDRLIIYLLICERLIVCTKEATGCSLLGLGLMLG